MGSFNWTKFLLCASVLFRGCLGKGKLGQPCALAPEEPCWFGMECVLGNCACQPNLYPATEIRCEKKRGQHVNCGSNTAPCLPGLNCTSGVCECPTVTDIHNGVDMCESAKLGEKCPKPDCDPKGFMECKSNKCACLVDNVEHPFKICGPPPKYGENCSKIECKANSNFICDKGKCVCSPPELVPHPANKCGPKAKFGEDCDRPECDSRLNLRCAVQGSAKKCACTPGNVRWPNLACGPPAKLGKSCVDWECDPTGNMDCNSSKICVCKTDNVEHPGGICGVPAVFGKPCDLPKCKDNFELTCIAGLCKCARRWMAPDGVGKCVDRPKSVLKGECELDEDCMAGFHLDCKGRRCECLKYHEQDPKSPDQCHRVPSLYREFCTEDSHCLQNQHMVCEKNGNYCDCRPSYDLDDLGDTPCVFNRLNGRTYEQPCEPSPPVRRCIASHNLTCTAGKCVCLHKYVPNHDTIAEATFGVVTCKVGGGTKNHGDKCEPHGNTIYQRCDDLLNLGCSVDYKVCSCAPGFIPTGDKDNPCDGGKQPYDASCDPPEVIIPPRGTDPITGLPIPGPTSPPPPKLACHPSLNLVCVIETGKCACRDWKVSKRYRLEPKSGKCLITNSYACEVDSDCFSGKCLTKEEAFRGTYKPPSHTHGEKICHDPSQIPPNGSPISGLLNSPALLVVSLIFRVIHFA